MVAASGEWLALPRAMAGPDATAPSAAELNMTGTITESPSPSSANPEMSEASESNASPPANPAAPISDSVETQRRRPEFARVDNCQRPAFRLASRKDE